MEVISKLLFWVKMVSFHYFSNSFNGTYLGHTDDQHTEMILYEACPQELPNSILGLGKGCTQRITLNERH